MRGAVNLRRVALTAATATVAVVAGMLPGTPSAASGPSGTVKLAYTCAFTASAASDGTDPGTSDGSADTSGPADATAVTEDATVTVHQEYPATGTVGAGIQPGRLTLEVALGKDAAAAVLPSGTTSAIASGSLTARVTQGSSAADTVWSDLVAPSTPTADGLDLTFTGDVSAVTVSAAGTVRFDAGALDLSVGAEVAATTPPSGSPTPSATATADGDPSSPPDAPDASSTSSAGASSPSGTGARIVMGTATGARAVAAIQSRTASCTPKAGQATELGKVAVTSGGPAATQSATASPSATGTATTDAAGSTARTVRKGTISVAEPPHSGTTTCPPPPTGEPDPAIIAAVPRPPAAAQYHTYFPPDQRWNECGYITGLANVGKLNGAAVFNDLNDHPTQLSVTETDTWDDPDTFYSEIDSIAEMTPPPGKATFLTFGFMPTSAVMTMTPVSLMTVVLSGYNVAGKSSETDIYGKMTLRLSDLTVNGTPLDVGSDCRAVAPLDIKLIGFSDTDHPELATNYNPITGGPVSQDDLYIPPFTGCTAHGENLDALLTASLSGHGNSLNFIQAPLCIPFFGDYQCLPEIAFPTPPHR